MFSGLPTASLTVTDLFSFPFHYSVPSYQRPYSWTTEEAGQLLEDILGAAGLFGPEAAEPDYFLGAILLLDSAGGDLPKPRDREARFFEIVDGQQRLVTLAVMAAVLRDLDAERRWWGSRSRLDQLIAADTAATKQRGARFRIELRTREQSLLENYVQERGSCKTVPALEGPSESEENLYAVREHFMRALSALEEADRRHVADYLCGQCHFVVVLTRDIDRAHRLFTVLNERGRALQRNDILKAELLKSVAPDRVGEALDQWERGSDLLGKNFETFFSHLFNIYGTGEKKIIAGIRRTVQETGGPERFLKEVFTPLAQAYHWVRCADDVDVNIDAEARRYLVYLGRLAEGDWAPAAMLALQNYSDDPERGNLLLKEIDRLAHLLRLLCSGTSKRARRFGHVMDLIKTKAPIVPGEGPFHITRDEVRNIAYHLRTFYKRDQPVCKLLLLRLNDELARSVTLLQPSDYSIEHVLPLRPGAKSEWRRWFPDAEEREACTESLGNLVVVTKTQNEKARNKEFARKREIYRGFDDTPVLPITRDALEAAVWRAGEIRAREARLMELIRDAWNIDLPGTQVRLDQPDPMRLRSDVA
jgi:uncharacterized protein DUF262/uncharacterized protein DUF1524